VTQRQSGSRQRYTSFLARPVSGPISDVLTRLTTETIQEISRPKDASGYTQDDYCELLKNCPVINAAYELKALRCSIALGKYTHKIKDAEKWVNENFEQMDGRLEQLIGYGSSAAYFGNFVAEIILRNDVPGYRGQWRLEGFRPLDPRYVKFAGNRHAITHVVYTSSGKTVYIPYGRVIHVVSDHSSFGDPYGSGGTARRAMPWYKAQHLLMSEWLVAGLNQARGLLIGKADSNETVEILDASGRPIVSDGKAQTRSAVEALMLQMMNLEKSNVLSTDIKNQIQWQPMPADANFFQLALQYINRQLLLSQLLPSLTFEEGIGGLGNSSIATVQQGMLDTQIEFITSAMKDQIVEKLVRLLLVSNFGITAREGWGEFVVTPSRDPNFAVQKANTIMSAIMSQVLPSSDITVMNELRDLLGLSQITENQSFELLQKQIRQQAMQQEAMAPPQPAAAEDQGQAAPQSGFAFYPGNYNYF
jgi:hypothetical protein